MKRKRQLSDILKRCPENPLIKFEDVPFRCADLWNCAITFFSGSYLMLLTVEELEGTYRLYKAVSENGMSFSFKDAEPVLCKDIDSTSAEYENLGIRDPRITKIDSTYYITYVAESNHGHVVGLAKTEDFSNFTRLPYATQVDVKSGPLFPRQINGHYCILKRPNAGHSMWLSFSQDLRFWGGNRCIMTPRGGFWDADRIGPAGPPLEIENGWLLIYYGVKVTSSGVVVRLGAAILDRDEPWKVKARSDIPLLGPREHYERLGDVPNVVFSCGHLTEGEIMHIYYGASDSCICRASAQISKIVDICLNGGDKTR